jgi:hypothetical protein
MNKGWIGTEGILLIIGHNHWTLELLQEQELWIITFIPTVHRELRCLRHLSEPTRRQSI